MILLLSWAESSLQLVPDATLVLHVLIIVLMVIVLNKTLFRPINRVLEERDRGSQGALEEARRLLATIDKDLARYELALRAARSDAYNIMDLQRAKEMQERESRLASVRKEILSLLEAEKVAIEEQFAGAHKVLEEEAQKLGLAISVQIMGRRLQSVREGDPLGF